MQQTQTAPWFYWRGKKPGRKKHYPSAPGEMPAIDSGELISRIVADQRPNEIEVGVEAGAPYAIFLEEGTPKMKARPFLQPTVDEEWPKIEDNIMKAIEKAAGDAFKK
jgi:HK97 gp10 family phage protein